MHRFVVLAVLSVGMLASVGSGFAVTIRESGIQGIPRDERFTVCIDSAMRLSHAGLHAAAITVVEQQSDTASSESSGVEHVVLEGLRAGMLSELGVLGEAEKIFAANEEELQHLASPTNGSFLRASLAMHHCRMARREKAYALLNAVVREEREHGQSAYGQYCLAVVQRMEGFEEEAMKGFEETVQRCASSSQTGAEAARYWATYADALERCGKVQEAEQAYSRAAMYADADPISRMCLAASIATRTAMLYIAMNRMEDARSRLRDADRVANEEVCPECWVGVREVQAQCELAAGNTTAAQERLVEGLWRAYRGLTQAKRSFSIAEVEALRCIAERMIDLAFALLLQDTESNPGLAAAAWNTHLALRTFGTAGIQFGRENGPQAWTKWLERRSELEQSCVSGHSESATAVHGPTIQSLRERLPQSATAIVFRRFLDLRGERKEACYAVLLIPAASEGSTQMVWLDAAGNFERVLLPRMMAHLQAPLLLEDVADWGALPARLRALPQSGILWEACLAPVLRHLDDRETVFLMPDGIFLQLDPAVIYSPGHEAYFGEMRQVTTLHDASGMCADVNRVSFAGAVHVPSPGPLALTQLPAATDTRSESASGATILEDFFRDDDLGASISNRPGTAAVDVIDAETTEEMLRERAPGPMQIWDAPIFLLADTIPDARYDFSPALPRTENPYLRGGVILAGAGSVSEAIQTAAGIPDRDDGILLSSEIAGLDRGTAECVVLTRCTLQAGYTTPFASVNALLRAFLMGGGRCVLHTLWYLPKKIVQDFLLHFQNARAHGDSWERAFHRARKHVQEAFPHPYFWGGFRLSHGALQHERGSRD